MADDDDQGWHLSQILSGFDGFRQPINETAQTLSCGSPCPASIFKGGSTVPVNFQLHDASGSTLVAVLCSSS